jgi:hypothetical protein
MSAPTVGLDCVPFLVLGQSRRTEIERALRAAVAGVLGEWIAAGDTRMETRTANEFRLECRERRSGRVHWMRFADSHELACFCFVDDKLLQASLEANPRGCAVMSGYTPLTIKMQQELHEMLAARVASALRLALNGSAEGGSLPDLMAEPTSHRWIVCSCDTPAHITIGFHPRLLERLSPARPPASKSGEAVMGRKGAIRANTVALHAVLGEAEIGCADLTRLAEGDVLVLNQDLTAMVKLLNADGALVASAQLGSADGRLALHLV